MHKAKRSSIQSTKTYKAFQAFQPQDLPQAFQFYKDIPVIHDIPVFQALLHVPVLPVPYKVHPGIPPTTAIQHFPVRIQNSTHRLVSTRNFIEYQSKTIQTFILQRKGDVVISVNTLTYSPE